MERAGRVAQGRCRTDESGRHRAGQARPLRRPSGGRCCGDAGSATTQGAKADSGSVGIVRSGAVRICGAAGEAGRDHRGAVGRHLGSRRVIARPYATLMLNPMWSPLVVLLALASAPASSQTSPVVMTVAVEPALTLGQPVQTLLSIENTTDEEIFADLG